MCKQGGNLLVMSSVFSQRAHLGLSYFRRAKSDRCTVTSNCIIVSVCSENFNFDVTKKSSSFFLCLQVKLLKDILEAWKAEVEKKPPTMSTEEAYKVLHLPSGVGGYVT